MEMRNVYEEVDFNKRRSAVVMILFIIFVVGFVWLLGQVFGTDPLIIVLAAAFSIGSALVSYYSGDKIILSLTKAKPANRQEHFNLYTSAENLALATQIPLPKLYVIESKAMNAFATGRDPQHAVICVTTGLLNRLNRSELEAVLAHEISHIINYDIRLMTITAILAGMIAILSDWVIRIRPRKDNRNTGGFLLIASFIALILAPVSAKLIQLAISRRREYFADAQGSKITRQPQALINALTKLSSSEPLNNVSPATAHLFIVNPFSKNKRIGKNISTLFSTHPPIEDRIKQLSSMT
jgi:heat shock protein HtpX